MSKTTQTPRPESPGQILSRRPFDGVIIALSAALLVIFGVVIGRFVVTSDAVAVVDRFDAELTALRAEVVDLHRQLLRAEARATARQESADQYQRLAAEQQTRADRLEAQQRVVDQMLGGIARQRTACLGEIQQYVALNRPIAATDVLRFAEEMFDAHTGTLQRLAGGDARAVDMPSLPAFQSTVTVTQDSLPLPSRGHAVVPSHTPGHVARDLPMLPSPTAAERMSPPSSNNRQGAFFAPPASRPPAGRCVFFAPGRSRPLASAPASPGIVFHDTATTDSQTVRR